MLEGGKEDKDLAVELLLGGHQKYKEGWPKFKIKVTHDRLVFYKKAYWYSRWTPKDSDSYGDPSTRDHYIQAFKEKALKSARLKKSYTIKL